MGISLSVLLFVRLRGAEWEHAREDFQQAAGERGSAVRRTLEFDFLVLKAVKLRYDSSQKVEPDEFRTFAVPLLNEHANVQGMGWIPRVKAADRAAFEQGVERDGRAGLRIVERSRSGSVVRAGRREEYFPLLYVEPRGSNISPMGLDMATDPAFLAAMRRAADSGELQGTTGVLLGGRGGGQVGQRVFLAVYRKGAPLATVEDRRRAVWQVWSPGSSG